MSRAAILRSDSGAAVSMDQMARLFPAPSPRAAPRTSYIAPADVESQTADSLNLPKFDELRLLIDAPTGKDRSGDTFALACRMVNRGYTDEAIVGVLLNPENSVAAHCMDKDSPLRAAVRALERAKQAVHRDRGSGAAKATEPLALIDAGRLVGVAVGDREFAIETLIPLDLVTLFTAPGGGGKSHIALYLCACVSLGALAFGLATSEATALYVTAEDDNDENHRRLIGVANALQVGLERFSGKLFLLSLANRRDKGLVRIDTGTNKMTTLPLFEQLRSSIIETGARFLVLDNVAHFFEGNEIVRAHVAAFLGLLNTLALETRCAIVLIGHPNKAGDDYSGSTAFQNQVRSHIHMTVDKTDRDRRLLALVKANYARQAEPLALRWHKGAFRLEREVMEDARGAATVLARTHDERFLACLDARTAQQLPTSKHTQAGSTYAPKLFATMPEAQGMKAGELKAAMHRLLSAGLVAFGQLDFDRPGSRGHKAEGLHRSTGAGIDDERM